MCGYQGRRSEASPRDCLDARCLTGACGTALIIAEAIDRIGYALRGPILCAIGRDFRGIAACLLLWLRSGRVCSRVCNARRREPARCGSFGWRLEVM